MPGIIEAQELNFAYVRVPVLEHISFTVNAGDYVGIIGPNGGGKTTLLKLLLGLEKGKGQIKLFGRPLNEFKDWRKIGYLAQKRCDCFHCLWCYLVSFCYQLFTNGRMVGGQS